MKRLLGWYGAGPLHLLSLLACFALAGYAAARLVPSRPLGVAVWFLGAVIGHDLVLMPLYSLADRSAVAVLRHRAPGLPTVAWINYVRVPAALSGLLLLVWFPLILRLTAVYHASTTLSADPYLWHWLAVTGALFLLSAVAFAVRLRATPHDDRGHADPAEDGPPPGRGNAVRAARVAAAMGAVEESLPLAVLDFVGIEYGESAAASIAGAVRIAQAVEAAGYRRYWVSEHHNMTSLACTAPELLTAHIGAQTSRIRVGAAGIMLPNHAPLKVAETFRTLLAMYPGRIDLALGRAPGTDPLTAHALRRGINTDPAAEFPGQVGQLLAFLGDGFPADHPYANMVAAPVVDERPELFVLGSSPYGPQFAAVNGMSAVFAHHMSPDLAFEALRTYRRDFTPGPAGGQPYSAMSVLAFASDDEEAVLDFEAAWALTMQNIRRGIREPLRPEQVLQVSRSAEFRAARQDDGRMVTGEPKAVAERLLEMKQQAEVDEIVVVTPSLDRDRRRDSYVAVADAWRRAA